MLVSRLALRLLLSLVLVLNGIGTGVAATGMTFQHAAPSGASAARSASPAPAAMSGCQHQGSKSAPASKRALSVGDTVAGKTGLPDCCKSRCAGACLQTSPAVISALPVPDASVKRVAGMPLPGQARFAPVLSDLNRPPIG